MTYEEAITVLNDYKLDYYPRDTKEIYTGLNLVIHQCFGSWYIGLLDPHNMELYVYIKKDRDDKPVCFRWPDSKNSFISIMWSVPEKPGDYSRHLFYYIMSKCEKISLGEKYGLK